MKTRRRRAFTLVEVLIALAVFTGSAIVLGSAYVNILTGYERARWNSSRDDDLRFARAALLAEPDIEKAREGGDFEAVGGRRFKWTATIDPTPTADLFLVVFNCEISGGDTKGTETATQEFRVIRPTWSVAAERETLRADAKRRIEEINTARR